MISQVNGELIPRDATLQDLKLILQKNDMPRFRNVCEALSRMTDDEAFEAMAAYLNDKDKYKRLCVICTIFRHPLARKIADQVEACLKSNDFIFVYTILNVIIENHIQADNASLLSAVRKYFTKLYSYHLQALFQLENTAENYASLNSLYRLAFNANGKREMIAQALLNLANADRFIFLYGLFSNDEFSKIRLLAIKLAQKFDHPELVTNYENDPNGHVRKYAAKALYGNISDTLP
jgi:HEAT repeat protein